MVRYITLYSAFQLPVYSRQPFNFVNSNYSSKEHKDIIIRWMRFPAHAQKRCACLWFVSSRRWASALYVTAGDEKDSVEMGVEVRSEKELSRTWIESQREVTFPVSRVHSCHCTLWTVSADCRLCFSSLSRVNTTWTCRIFVPSATFIWPLSLHETTRSIPVRQAAYALSKNRN